MRNGILQKILISMMLISCKENSDSQVSYCYGQNGEGRIMTVICENIAKEECERMNDRSDLRWSFDIGEESIIEDPPLPN